MSGSARETLPDVLEVLPDVRKTLPDVREWSGGLSEVREWSGGPPGCLGGPLRRAGGPSRCPGVVGKPSRMSESGGEDLADVREL